MAYWTLVISVFCYVGISALTGKGYYCRDPDTGKLYPVNSSWPSSSFCGNYTCKLRKKDTAKTVIPIRQMVIDSISPSTKAKSAEEEIMQTEGTENYPISTILTTLHPKLLTEAPITASTTTVVDNNVSHNDESNSIEIKPLSTEHGDRYLTDGEIKSISQLLYSVKKSDLEAIVDIYNLAQDIYKEMDKITSQNIIEETVKAAKTAQKNEGGKHYWYEPLNRMSKVGVATDMEFHGTNLYPTAVEKSTVDPNSYFQGPLTKTDFGTLPYYYPLSSFQREYSYVHATNNPQQYTPRNEKPPCSQSTPYPYYPRTEPPKVYQPSAPSHYSYYPAQTYGSVLKKSFPVETQKVIQPSVLLPYPFSYVQHYNMSAYPYNLYYSGNSWSHFDVNNKNNDKTEQYFRAYSSQDTKNAVSTKTENKLHTSHKENIIDQNIETKLHESNKAYAYKDESENKHQGEKKNLLDTLLEQAKIEPKSKPEWQTDPLASNVLEDIKAHFEEKARLLKPFSLRKKAKLERVGKVLKLDDLNRDKRSADGGSLEVVESVDESFEAYMEKTTCQSDVEPGFYQMGNLTQPYPACCPRKIENTNR